MQGSRKPKLGAVSAEYVFLDVVAYSKRTIESQIAIIDILNGIVRQAVEVHGLPSERVIYLPTGDGICIALLNVDDPYDVQMQVALGILARLHHHNLGTKDQELRFQVRIGVNANRDNL